MKNGKRSATVKAVAEQLVNMLVNNFMEDYTGSEPFMGWLAGGEVWDGESEEEIERRLELAGELAPYVDVISYKLDEFDEED